MSANSPTRRRPVSAPAYYLGRPADVWITAARRRAAPVADRELARQQTRPRR
jgi:hypothetical protein